MKGYIFEYYKYIRHKERELEGLFSEPIYKLAEKSILTFGEYDRLAINTIDDFSRFRDLSELSKKWVGNKQSILLYDLEEEPEIIFDNDEEIIIVRKLEESKECDEHLFWALTVLPFRSLVREKMESYEDLLRDEKVSLSKELDAKIREDSIEVEYTFFGTLGTFGIAVLWRGNQFTDILDLVNMIKGHRKEWKEGEKDSLYLAAHTIFSKNPKYNNMDESNELLERIKGKAFIHATLKEELKNKDEYKFPYCHAKITHTTGEYDIVIEVDAKDAYFLFENINEFNHDTNEYQKNYLQTKVVLGKGLKCRKNKKDKEISNSEEAIKNYKNSLEEVDVLYHKVRALLEENANKTTGLIDTLDTLVFDYRSIVLSAVNGNWAKDFFYVFKKHLECIKEIILLKTDPKLKEELYDEVVVIRLILNNLNQQVFHITEAHNLNLETPKCHLRYTGQEDGLLFCYMGIIKEILQEAYQLSGINKQPELVPLVTADAVPIVESEMYFDKTLLVKEDENEQDFKILFLNLPHVAFYEIPVYFQYLYHEIYHYITPGNREKRDYIIGHMIVTTIIIDVLSVYLKNIGVSKEASKILGEALCPLVFSAVTDLYKELHKTVMGEFEAKGNSDILLLVSKVYTRKLILHISDVERNGFMKSCMSAIGIKLKEKNNINEGIENDIDKYIMDSEIKKKFYDCFNSKKLSNDIKNILEDRQLEIGEHIDKVLVGLKEAAADISMIELTNMSLSEYLIFYVNCLKNKMITCEMVSSNEEKKEQIRIGLILLYYKGLKEELESIENTFENQYIARYITSKNKNLKQLRKEISRIAGEAQAWLDFFRMCQGGLQNKYGIFLEVFKEYCQILSVKERLQEDKIEQKCKLYWNGYRNAVEQFVHVICYIRYTPHEEHDQENLWKRYNDARKSYKKYLFRENIRIYKHFQKQTSLENLGKVNEENNKKKAAYFPKQKLPKFNSGITSKKFYEGKNVIFSKVYDFGSLARVIQEDINHLRNSARCLLNKNNIEVWYRGQEDDRYSLLPSIARKNTINKRDFNYLAQYQRYLYGEFKFRSDGSGEMLDCSRYTTSDYLALMQHYGVPTNLMDWSENAFTALYFALEDVLTHEKEVAETSAVLWIFSPQLYNDARKYMIQHEAMKESCTESAFRASIKTMEGFDSNVPNLAVEYNEKSYDMFLLGNLDYETNNKYGYRTDVNLSGHKEMAYLPLAIYTSRLNPRVRTQSGMFVAYNLYAEPSILTEYEYMDLEKIQDYYMKNCKRKDKRHFLYKIVIDKSAIKEIAECVENLGFNKSKIYPELFNVGERIK